MKVALSNDFNGKLLELSKRIASWNLIKGSSTVAYEELAEKILKHLNNGEAKMKIKNIIESDLCSKYGLFKTEFDGEKLTNEILAWWNKRF